MTDPNSATGRYSSRRRAPASRPLPEAAGIAADGPGAAPLATPGLRFHKVEWNGAPSTMPFPTIDKQLGAGDETRITGGQEQRTPGNLAGIANPAQRHAERELIEQRLLLGSIVAGQTAQPGGRPVQSAPARRSPSGPRSGRSRKTPRCSRNRPWCRPSCPAATSCESCLRSAVTISGEFIVVTPSGARLGVSLRIICFRGGQNDCRAAA